MSNKHEVDMSPKAVTRRLKETSDLLKLCLILEKGKDMGPVERPSVAAAAERKLKRRLARSRAKSAPRR